MMIDPERLYEFYLKGKNEEQLLAAIRSLKRENTRLKRIMEHPQYVVTVLPDESTRLWCNRLYLERAKVALQEVGGRYVPSKAEQKSEEFDKNVPNIKKLSLIRVIVLANAL